MSEVAPTASESASMALAVHDPIPASASDPALASAPASALAPAPLSVPDWSMVRDLPERIKKLSPEMQLKLSHAMFSAEKNQEVKVEVQMEDAGEHVKVGAFTGAPAVTKSCRVYLRAKLQVPPPTGSVVRLRVSVHNGTSEAGLTSKDLNGLPAFTISRGPVRTPLPDDQVIFTIGEVGISQWIPFFFGFTGKTSASALGKEQQFFLRATVIDGEQVSGRSEPFIIRARKETAGERSKRLGTLHVPRAPRVPRHQGVEKQRRRPAARTAVTNPVDPPPPAVFHYYGCVPI